jgi:hypothetical protein
MATRLKGPTLLEGTSGSVMGAAARVPVLILLAVGAMALLGGCGVAAPQGSVVSPPEASASPLPTVSVAVAQTRLQTANLLSAQGYQLLVPTQPYRPPESPRLSVAARAVFQVALPNDPTHGYILIYEFGNTDQASLAGNEMAGYIGSGPGRIQFQNDSQHVLRQVGTTLILYSWSPANSPGPDAPRIGAILSTIGQGFAIPR